jgi:uncharacterized membrane protein YhaH (DUF805 family)
LIPYVVGGIITRVVAALASIKLADCDGGDQAGMYATTALMAVWMWYCVSSRRMHDTGGSNGFLTILMLAEAGLLLCHLFPDQFGARSERAVTMADLLIIQRFLNVAVCAYGTYLFKVPSDPGDNVHGPPFGRARNGGWKVDLPGTGQQLPRSGPPKPAAGIARLGPKFRKPAAAFAAVPAASINAAPLRRPPGFGRR